MAIKYPMNPESLHDLLKNYQALLARVDAHVKQVTQDYSHKIACKKGCDSCCRFLTLFPVEAFAISAAFVKLDPSRQEPALANPGEKKCPLLVNRECLLYEVRPIICRTHGFPLYFIKNGSPRVDFCPKNFTDMAQFPQKALLDLDQMNTLLAAINTLFLENIESFPPFPDRIPMSQALVLILDME